MLLTCMIYDDDRAATRIGGGAIILMNLKQKARYKKLC